MGSSISYPISPAQYAALEPKSDADGFVRFDHFMEAALYHPTEGYYCRDRERVGRSAETDFFTASSLGPVFGELVVAACLNLLGDHDPAFFSFVEIGAERGRSIIDGVAHPFSGTQSIGAGDVPEIEGAAIVFSNELFDAQPCRRFRGGNGGWVEIGLALTGSSITESSRPVDAAIDALPASVPEGYCLDLPSGANALAENIVGQPWHGLFLAFDYGKSWAELSTEVPQGTARAYHQHRQKTNLLESMGEQDLTCHICWDHLSEILSRRGFTPAKVLSQEAFLVENAADKLAELMASEAEKFSSRKSGLMQLLHPAALGQKFQVISAWRQES